jgi:hypothetical protein
MHIDYYTLSIRPVSKNAVYHKTESLTTAFLHPRPTRTQTTIFLVLDLMSALIDPDDDPIERCAAMCSECLFELKQDVFAIDTPDSHDQDDDVPFKTTVMKTETFFLIRTCC